MPYLAARAEARADGRLHALDIDAASGNLLQTRPAIGGNILATIQTPRHRPQMATVRPRSARSAAAIPGRQVRDRQVQLLSPPAELLTSRVRRAGIRRQTSETHDLRTPTRSSPSDAASRRRANLPLVARLARALDAALGATRDVVDRGWLSYPHQVGLSGKTVTARLYVGCRRLRQHPAPGRHADLPRPSSLSTATRTPRYSAVADFGIVGDLFEVVPVLTKKLAAARTGRT